MDLRQFPQYAKYMKSIGWLVEKVNGNYIYVRKIPLTPSSVIKIQRSKKIPFKQINQLAKKHRAVVIYLEPNVGTTIRYTLYTIHNHGYRFSKSPFLPTKTIHLDLTRSEGKILAQMKKDARYGIRKARGTVIKKFSNEEIKEFHQAWKKSVSWRRYIPSLESLKALKKSFGRNAIFLTATHSNTLEYRTKTAAGAVVLLAGKAVYYYYAFSSKEGRQKLAQYLLVWEAIKEAKKQGCKIFDFEGIYDKRFPQKSWKGFSHFKKSFGGKEIEYPGCFVKYRFPF